MSIHCTHMHQDPSQPMMKIEGQDVCLGCVKLLYEETENPRFYAGYLMEKHAFEWRRLLVTNGDIAARALAARRSA